MWRKKHKNVFFYIPWAKGAFLSEDLSPASKKTGRRLWVGIIGGAILVNGLSKDGKAAVCQFQADPTTGRLEEGEAKRLLGALEKNFHYARFGNLSPEEVLKDRTKLLYNSAKHFFGTNFSNPPENALAIWLKPTTVPEHNVAEHMADILDALSVLRVRGEENSKVVQETREFLMGLDKKFGENSNDVPPWSAIRDGFLRPPIAKQQVLAP